MLSYLLLVVSLVNHSGFVNEDKTEKTAELAEGGETTGGLIVKMGPVFNVHVADVRVFPGARLAEMSAEMSAETSVETMSEFPTIAPKGSLFESFSQSPLYAIRYGK
jgi:hypothetical protein